MNITGELDKKREKWNVKWNGHYFSRIGHYIWNVDYLILLMDVLIRNFK